MTERELFVFAATIWGEARGELLPGKQAVAWVILNRAARPGWPDRVAEVCLQPKQFSVWNDRDPNRAKAMLASFDDAPFLDCMYAAIGALRGHLEDPTDGADHYHTTSISPPWAREMTRTAIVGAHVFYDSGRRAGL